MAATRPISSVYPERFQRDSKDIEDLKLFILNSGSYQDITTPAVRYTRLTGMTSGSKVGGMRVRGGSV